MQSVVRILTTLLLSAVLIVPAAAFQKCCCDRTNRTAASRPCCAQAKLRSKLRSKLRAAAAPDAGQATAEHSQPTENRSHRCPCVKHGESAAVNVDRIKAPAVHQLMLAAHAPSPDLICGAVSSPTPQQRDTGPPPRIALGVWRL